MGYLLLYEGMLASVLHARDAYLKPDGVCVCGSWGPLLKFASGTGSVGTNTNPKATANRLSVIVVSYARLVTGDVLSHGQAVSMWPPCLKDASFPLLRAYAAPVCRNIPGANSKRPVLR
jgi:hypothetical protein